MTAQNKLKNMEFAKVDDLIGPKQMNESSPDYQWRTFMLSALEIAAAGLKNVLITSNGEIGVLSLKSETDDLAGSVIVERQKNAETGLFETVMSFLMVGGNNEVSQIEIRRYPEPENLDDLKGFYAETALTAVVSFLSARISFDLKAFQNVVGKVLSEMNGKITTRKVSLDTIVRMKEMASIEYMEEQTVVESHDNDEFIS